MKPALSVLLMFAASATAVGCGSTLRSQANACAEAPSLLCDYRLRDYAAEDPEGARDAYRRMTTQMVRQCDELRRASTATGSQGEGDSREITNAAFMCLRLAALELGAVGIEAGRIISDQSALAPDAVPANWDEGVGKLDFLCGANATEPNDTYRSVRGTGASDEACLMLGDIAHAQRDLVRAHEYYETSCRESYPSNEGQFASCITNAPTRSEARWLAEGVRAHMPPGTPSDLAVAPAVTTAAATSPAAPAPAVATPPRASSGDDHLEADEEPHEPLPVCLAPPSHPCLGTWTTTIRSASGQPIAIELRLDRNEGIPSVCGGYRQHFTTGSDAHWGLVRCTWQEHGMTAVAQSRESETLNFQLECRGNQATLDSPTQRGEGEEEHNTTRRLRRRR